MNEFDLAALVPDIDTCINAYEMACRKAIAKSQPEQIEPYAVSLHFSPIMQALFTLNVTDSASMTQEEIYNEHAQHIPEAEISIFGFLFFVPSFLFSHMSPEIWPFPVYQLNVLDILYASTS